MKYCTCENKKPLKAEKTNLRYTACGLDNVVLLGVETHKCPVCGEQFFSFGNIEQLHNKIAETLILKKGKLSGKEVRFLRKHLGYGGKMFARLIGISPEHLSRIENESTAMSEAFDRSVRLAVFGKLPDRDYDLHDKLIKDELEERKRLQFKKSSQGWALAA